MLSVLEKLLIVIPCMTVQIYISFLAVYDDNSFKNKLPVDIVTVVIKQHKTLIQMKKRSNIYFYIRYKNVRPIVFLLYIWVMCARLSTFL